MGASKTQTVIDLVHRLDVLRHDKAKLSADLDKQIEAAMRQLGRLTGEGNSGAPNKAQGQRRPKRVAGTSFAKTVLEMMAKNPAITYGDLASSVYGECTPASRHKVRSIVYFLRKEKKVQGEPGAWEVAASN